MNSVLFFSIICLHFFANNRNKHVYKEKAKKNCELLASRKTRRQEIQRETCLPFIINSEIEKYKTEAAFNTERYRVINSELLGLFHIYLYFSL